MANHRAQRRAPSLRSMSEARDASSPAATVAGKRKAVRTSRTARAADPAATRSFAVRPSAPGLVGVAALALAAVGATVSQSSLSLAGDDQDLSSQVSGHTTAGSPASGEASPDRQQTVSRSGERDARAAAEKAAAEKAAAEKAAAEKAAAEKAAAEKRAAEKRAAEKRAAEKAAAAKAAAEKRAAEKRAAEIAANAWQLPIRAGGYQLTSTFGECSSLWSDCHTGLDFAAPAGTPIHSVARGTVTEVGYAGAYGNRTIVTLENGAQVWYCHQNSTSAAVGQKVAPGDVIGTVGVTGNVTGPHLHLEVRPGGGEAVDPAAALRAHGVRP